MNLACKSQKSVYFSLKCVKFVFVTTMLLQQLEGEADLLPQLANQVEMHFNATH